MDKYRPSNVVPFSSIFTFIVTTIIVGLVAGAIVAFVSQQIYLIMLFPLIMAMVAGFATAFVVTRSKVRNPFIATLFGILTGALLYATYQYGSYLIFKQTVTQQIISDKSADSSQANAACDLVLQEKTGKTGFLRYLQYTADAGVTFVSTSDSFSGNNTTDNTNPSLQGNGVYIYWAIELLAVAAIAGGVSGAAARRPFCENCNTWYTGKGIIARVDRKQSRQFVRLLKRGQFTEAKALYGNPQKRPYTNLEIEYCRTCQTAPVVISAKRIVRNTRNAPVLTRSAVSQDQIKQLLPDRAVTNSVSAPSGLRSSSF